LTSEPEAGPPEPPRPSTVLFWTLVLSTVLVFGAGTIEQLVAGEAAPVEFSDASLAVGLLVEVALAAFWGTLLQRRGWSRASATLPAEAWDLARGASLFAWTYVGHVTLFWLVLVLAPPFGRAASHSSLTGSPSVAMIVLVSCVNPVVEEFFYLGFITNLQRPNGASFAILAGLLPRMALHVYQGPGGIIMAVGMGAILGAYYLATRRLWPVVVAHAITDVIGLAGLASQGG
jgi:membrane protease YdiL (CAAX protease family)